MLLIKKKKKKKKKLVMKEHNPLEQGDIKGGLPGKKSFMEQAERRYISVIIQIIITTTRK